jgi:glycosyltransferase involved in cell wall biosynthesis
LHSPRLVKKKYLKYYKKNFVKFLEKAQIITTLSNFCKNSIIGNYKIDPVKIEVVNCGVDEAFRPIDLSGREKIKEQYAKGSEYFLFYGSPHHGENLFLILKAFSVFKKWQKSSMQLLIVRSHDLKPKELQSIRLFKYYEDVRIVQPLPHDLKQITAAAYAVIDFSYYESFGIHSLEAMKCNVPIISDNESAMSEVCDDAALYINNEYKVLAEKMMMIYKDETLRNKLIEKGKKQVEKFSWEKTAGLFWQSILKACS